MFNVRKHHLESAEFAQLLKCCHAGMTSDLRLRTSLQISRGVDWARFLNLARRHRVQGLVWRSLQELRGRVPVAVAEALAKDATANATHGLNDAAESARLLTAFRSAGVAVIYLKGLALAQLAYGNPFVKMGWDIDILIQSKQLARAETLLLGAGYEMVTPTPDRRPNRLQRWHQTHKESVWRKRHTNIHLELHTRLADNPCLLPTLTADSATQTVKLAPGIELPTLAPDELFAYLCVHGSSSAWFRLKWLTDFAAMAQNWDAPEISRLYERAQELGAGRAPAQALLLARDLFGTRLEPELSQRLEGARSNRQLARIAYAQLLQSDEPTQRRFGTVTIHTSQFVLSPSLSFKIAELNRQAGELTRKAFRSSRGG